VAIVLDIQNEFIADEVDFHRNLLGLHHLQKVIDLCFVGQIHAMPDAVGACLAHGSVDVPVQVFRFNQSKG
jgi:hypothetical protein